LGFMFCFVLVRYEYTLCCVGTGIRNRVSSETFCVFCDAEEVRSKLVSGLLP
jgi:hypothetical protein